MSSTPVLAPPLSPLAAQLFHAAGRGDAHALRAALARGANPKAREGRAPTALMRALEPENAECAFLLAPLSDLSARDLHGQTALHLAAATGSSELLIALGARDPAVCAAADRYGDTPLIIAARRGQRSAVEILLPASDPLAANHDGETALMACSYGQLPLLLPVSDPLALDSNGDSALMLAAWERSPAHIRALIPVSQPNIQNRRGATALHWAIGSHNHGVWPDLAAVTDLTLRDKAGRTPLMMPEITRSTAPFACLLPKSAGDIDAYGLNEAIQSAQKDYRHAFANALIGARDALLEREALRNAISEAAATPTSASKPRAAL